MNILNMTNQTHLALESVKFLSKKIHKYPKYIRKPLVKHVKHSRGSVMNLSFAEDSLSTCDLHSNAESFSFSEEEKTEDLSIKTNTVSYVSPMYNRTYNFSCFSEKEIVIPEECRNKIVELSCDDDCMTDDDQIKGAIKKLYSSLQESVEKRNKANAEK